MNDYYEDNVNFREQTSKKNGKGVPAWLISLAITLPISVMTIFVCFVMVLGARVLGRTKTAQFSGTSESVTVEAVTPGGETARSALSSVVNIKNSGGYGGIFGQSFSYSEGSGVVLSSDGYILTSASVAENEEDIQVTSQDGTSYEAELVRIDSANNAALLKIEAQNLAAVTVGDASAVSVGDAVVVIANRINENLSNPVTAGIVCGINNGVQLQGGGSVNVFQIDASAISSSVGAPIFNSAGELVGITTAMISNPSSEIGLATPINDLSELIGGVTTVKGETSSGLTIGISGSNGGQGVVVEMVEEGSPAEKAGIKTGDLIVKADGEGVKTVNDITNIKNRHKQGDTMKLTVYRDGEMMEMDIIFE